MRNVPGTECIRKHSILGYEIFKQLNGKYTYLGRGKTLIIALMKRDWCQENNWKPYPSNFKYIRETPNGNFIIEKTTNKKTKSYGTFKTLEEAEEEVKLLRKCNWDYDALCESIDESQNGITFVSEDKMLKTSFERQSKRNDGWLFNKYINNPQFRSNQNYRKAK